MHFASRVNLGLMSSLVQNIFFIVRSENTGIDPVSRIAVSKTDDARPLDKETSKSIYDELFPVNLVSEKVCNYLM